MMPFDISRPSGAIAGLRAWTRTATGRTPRHPWPLAYPPRCYFHGSIVSGLDLGEEELVLVAHRKASRPGRGLNEAEPAGEPDRGLLHERTLTAFARAGEIG